MENKFIENNIKSTFDSYQPELDNDAIWEEIEPHLNKKKDRKYFIFWFLLVGLAIGFWFYNNDSHSIIEEDNLVLTENKTPIAAKELIQPNMEKNESAPIANDSKTKVNTVKKQSENFVKRKSVTPISIIQKNESSLINQSSLTEIKKNKVSLPNWNTDLINAKSKLLGPN